MKHYDDSEIESLLSGERNLRTADCADCAAEAAKLKTAADEFRAGYQDGAERSGGFWSAQRARIRERVATHRRRTGFAWAMASSAAVFALGAGLLVPGTLPTQPAPAQVVTVSDEALLQQIEEKSSSMVPEALAPADLLAQEVDRGLRFASEQNKGERE